MEGVANLKRAVRPGFAHNMTFEQGHEEVGEKTIEHAEERATAGKGNSNVNRVPRHDAIEKGSVLKAAILQVERL